MRCPGYCPKPYQSVVVVQYKFLNSPAGDRLGDIDVTVRGAGPRVGEGKLSRTVSGARANTTSSESSDHPAARLVQNPDVIVPKIHVDDEPLARGALVGEKIDVRPKIHVTGARPGFQNGRLIPRRCFR